MLLQVLDDGVAPQVEIMAIDSGEGMRDTERCFRDGYSTGGTAGTGLGAVRRLSALFDIFSAAGRGTVVVSRIGRKGDASTRSESLEYGAVCLALEGEAECGDTWRVADRGARLALFVADGLGHGALAATAARAAAEGFAERPFEAPASGMQNLHRSLLGGRGAVAAWAELQVEEARVEYAGVGNICGVIVAKDGTQSMVSYNGTLGVQLSRTRQFSYTWPADSLVVMHSDGLSAALEPRGSPGSPTVGMPRSLQGCCIENRRASATM